MLIDFGDSDEAKVLLDNLKHIAKVQGITQKRLFLIGVASYLETRGDNALTIQQIADYLSMPRKKP